MNQKEGIKLKCEHCGYLWTYGGSQERATCPSCSVKTKVVKENAVNNKEWKEYNKD